MANPTISKSSLEDVDIHVGKRIRVLRTFRGLTQVALGTRLGVSFQQLQKYETGYNRVSASTLYAVAMELGCPPAVFFEGLPGCGEPSFSDLDKDALKIAASYSSLPNQSARLTVETLVATLTEIGAS